MKYFMKTDKDEEFVNRVVAELNSRMDQLEKMINSPDTQKVAVMAAFSFAAECMQLSEEKGISISKIEDIIDKTA